MIYDQYGAAIGVEFEMFAATLKTLYIQTRAAARGLEAGHNFRMLGLAQVVSFMQRATDLTRDFMNGIGLEFTSDRDTPVLNTLRGVAIKNVNDLSLDIMAPTQRMADLLNRPAGYVGLLLQKRLADPELVAIDRAGRKWQAAALVKTVARDFAYQAYIDFQVDQILDSGANAAEVVWMNPEHPNYGDIVMLSGSSKLHPDLAAVRSFYFHPNATAQLRAKNVPT